MSRKGGRSRTGNEQNITPFPPKRHLRIVKDELADEGPPLVGGAMSLAHEECSDDRRPPPEGPGMWLRRNREARGLTIEDLARTTKISKTILRAIESADVVRLPADIYTRGFVKSYAREVGLDPDRTADEYLTRLEPLTAQSQIDHGQLTPIARSADAAVEAQDDARPMLPAGQLRRFSWVTTALALTGLIVYLVFADRDVSQNPPGVTAADAAVAAHGVPATPPMEREAVALTSGAALAAGGPLRVEITTQSLCWLVITVDGVPMLARLLQAGERHTFDVAQEAALRVGDPGALTLSINGQTARPLGPAGQPVDVRITKDNFRQFLGA